MRKVNLVALIAVILAGVLFMTTRSRISVQQQPITAA